MLNTSGFEVVNTFFPVLDQEIAPIPCIGMIGKRSDATTSHPYPIDDVPQMLYKTANMNFRFDWGLTQHMHTDRPVYVWGMSLLACSIIGQTGLRDCNIVGLIDIAEMRQHQTISGMPICGPELLKDAGEDTLLVLTFVDDRHVASIKRMLEEQGYRGSVIRFSYKPDESIFV